MAFYGNSAYYEDMYRETSGMETLAEQHEAEMELKKRERAHKQFLEDLRLEQNEGA